MMMLASLLPAEWFALGGGVVGDTLFGQLALLVVTAVSMVVVIKGADLLVESAAAVCHTVLQFPLGSAERMPLSPLLTLAVAERQRGNIYRPCAGIAERYATALNFTEALQRPVTDTLRSACGPRCDAAA